MAPPVLVIVPGASSLPWLFDDVVGGLRARGLRAEALHLPSVSLPADKKPGPPPDMYDDAARVAARAEELADAGDDVLVATHSYGGTPGTQAVRGLSKKERAAAGKPGGVVGLAYISSLVPRLGENAVSVQASMPESDRIPAVVGEDGWVSMADIPKAAALIFSNMPKEEAESWTRKFGHHAAAAFGSPLTHAGYKDVPVSYLVCEDDRVIPARIQRDEISMIEAESGNKVNVTSLPLDHGPPASAPSAITDWLAGVALGSH